MLNPNLCGKWALIEYYGYILTAKINSNNEILSEGHCNPTETESLFPSGTLRDSYWFIVGEDGAVKDSIFVGKQISPDLIISREDLNSIKFPVHLVDKESYIIIEFLPSGNYVIN